MLFYFFQFSPHSFDFFFLLLKFFFFSILPSNLSFLDALKFIFYFGFHSHSFNYNFLCDWFFFQLYSSVFDLFEIKLHGVFVFYAFNLMTRVLTLRVNTIMYHFPLIFFCNLIILHYFFLKNLVLWLPLISFLLVCLGFILPIPWVLQAFFR